MTTTHHITAGVVLALALGASAAPASARPFDINPNGSYVPAGSVSMQAPSRSATPIVPAGTSNLRSARPTVASSPDGFQWGGAGIGAAGGVVLSMIGVGGALAMSQRRTRSTHHTTALTG
ncbi:MAG: hypothetical protein M3076_05650 [Actinomycetota bacterium]|nr:hypothetical protein [Actinomycetota bacterium]